MSSWLMPPAEQSVGGGVNQGRVMLRVSSVVSMSARLMPSAEESVGEGMGQGVVMVHVVSVESKSCCCLMVPVWKSVDKAYERGVERPSWKHQ